MRTVSSIAAVLGAVVLSHPAYADYMTQCEALISRWEDCGADLAACTIVEIEIMQQCRCHEFDDARFEWVFVTAENAPDGVCGNFEPIPEEPGPGEPTPPLHRPEPGQEVNVELPIPRIGAENGAAMVEGAAVGADQPAHSD